MTPSHRDSFAIQGMREALVTALGVVSEGCSVLMKDKLETVLGIVLGAALRDHELVVRKAALFALGQFA